MSMPARHEKLVRQSEHALIAAIEVYNKPSFTYREENFSILVLNAWELLLKSKLLKDHKNDDRKLWKYKRLRKKDETTSSQRRIVRNRSGNPRTISLHETIAALAPHPASRIPQPVKSNLDALIEIRDNAVHYMNPAPTFSKAVLEIGTASVRNYLNLGQKWFNLDLSLYDLFLLPIGFLHRPAASAVKMSPSQQKLLDYLLSLQSSPSDGAPSDYYLSLEVKFDIGKSQSDTIEKIQVVKDDPDAVRVTLTDEVLLDQYPWDYERLCATLSDRYTDFKINRRFWDLKKGVEANQNFVWTRYLNPNNPKGGRKLFYSRNVVQEFDKYHTRR